MEPQRMEAKYAQPQGVRTTENVGEEEERSKCGVWRETVVVMDLREPSMVPPTQSDSRKVECAETTRGASIKPGTTVDAPVEP